MRAQALIPTALVAGISLIERSHQTHGTQQSKAYGIEKSLRQAESSNMPWNLLKQTEESRASNASSSG